MSNKVIDYVMNSPQNTNPNVLKGLLESSEQEGGNSDYTIAEVSITNNTSNQLIYAVPYIAPYDEDEVLYSLAYFPANETIALNIVLYKGSVRMVLNSGNPPSATCTGDIRGKGTTFNISGNGTITFGTAS